MTCPRCNGQKTIVGKFIGFNTKVSCPDCNGSGTVCSHCKGAKTVVLTAEESPLGIAMKVDCPDCSAPVILAQA